MEAQVSDAFLVVFPKRNNCFCWFLPGKKLQNMSVFPRESQNKNEAKIKHSNFKDKAFATKDVLLQGSSAGA